MSSARDLSANPGRFVLFTALYNGRAYYPVLAILFLDLGLTLDQFVLLNLIWAATIFLFEVPSGALADTFGRRRLLIAAAVLMVMEMSCLLLAPRDGGWVLFWLCVMNRIFSGLSEAAASGADEALAYESLPEADRSESWDHLLAKAMRWRSVGFVVAMILGGFLYDATAINRVLPESLHLSAAVAHRLPVALVLCQAFACLALTLRMVEPPPPAGSALRNTCGHAVRLTLRTAVWVFTHRRTLVVVVIGLFIDSFVRNFATINSSYYRLIEYPEWTFGIIGAATGALGWFVPGIARRMNRRFGTFANLAFAAGLVFLGLGGLVLLQSHAGLIPVMVLMTSLGFVGFTVSRALHRETDSEKRATVLSVKGLAFNLGYGLFSLGFSRVLAAQGESSAEDALRHALFWQVPVYALGAFVLLAWGSRMWEKAADER